MVVLGKSEVACSSPVSGEHRPVDPVTERGRVCINIFIISHYVLVVVIGHDGQGSPVTI